MTRRNEACAQVCELLKALWRREASAEELASELGINVCTARVWLQELEDNGIVTRRRDDSVDCRIGPPPLLFTVAPQWGGQIT